MKGPSLLSVALLLGSSLTAQQPPREPLRPPKLRLAEVVLSDAQEGVDLADFGLGDGGVNRQRGQTGWEVDGACRTAGGVHVACRSVGVKLTFPSGRELLVAPDGVVHLRGGEMAGPFPQGFELLLADGDRVRISLAQGRRNRVRDVLVVPSVGRRALQPWRRGKACRDEGRVSNWAGVRLAACGDGGDLYRPLALGPLLVLDRVLVEQARADNTPSERLVVLTDPLMKSLATMHRQHREVDKDVRHAVTAVASVARRGDVIFPAKATLQRAEREDLRWLLGGGFELQLELTGPLAPRLELYAGTSALPMVEWTLGNSSAAYMANPNKEQLGKRWHGNGTRLPQVVPELQAREHLSERSYAMEVIRRMAGERAVVVEPVVERAERQR